MSSRRRRLRGEVWIKLQGSSQRRVTARADGRPRPLLSPIRRGTHSSRVPTAAQDATASKFHTKQSEECMRKEYIEVRRPGSATGQTHTRLRCCGAQHARARCCALPFATLCVFSRLFHVCLPLDVVMMIYTCSPCKSAFLGANVFVIFSCWYV